MKLLIDADIIVYSSAADLTVWECEGHVFHLKSEAKEAFPNGTPVKTATYAPTLDYCKLKVEQAIEGMRRYLDDGIGADTFTLYLTEEGEKTNFRKTIASTYKAHRKNLVKPQRYHEVRQYIQDKYKGKVVVSEGQEADDDIGIEHYKPFLSAKKRELLRTELKTVVCSRDKDRLTLPGWSFDPYARKLQFITRDMADRNFYMQLLMGDKADNIIGLPGIGPVKAAKIIDECKTELDMYKKVCYNYIEQWGEEGMDKLLANGKLLRIRRWEGEIWSPPDQEER